MKALAAALVDAQKKMPAVAKTATANYGKYATLDSLIASTRTVLNDHGLAISQFPAELDHGGPGLKTVLLHGESGETIEATVPLLLNGKNDMQALGGAITYARRYGWAAVLGIANDEDDDGNAVSSPAPGTGASQTSSSAGSVVGAGLGGGGADAGASPVSPASPTTSDEWRYPFGKHKSKTVAQVEEEDPGWHDWFLQNSDKDDIKQRINEHRNLAALGEVQGGSFVEPDDIPFEATVDGLGG